MLRNSLYLFFCCNFLYVCCLDFQCIKPEWFACDNGECISFLMECDGGIDCSDGSDEKNCQDFKFVLPSVNCTTDEYKCKNNDCIPIEKFCDTKNDCTDKSDEYYDCVKDKKCDTFRCNDGYCIKNEWKCDGMPDCPDGSDEINCDNITLTAGECNNEIDRYLCNNGKCISLSMVCDNNDDCGDNSDESVEDCKKADVSCSNSTCDHICRKTPRGPTCTCRPGYQLKNNLTCSDINECNKFGVCDQHCTNTAGSYVCSCENGYVLEDDSKHCKAEGGEALMVFALNNEIRGYYIDSEIYYPVVNNLLHVIGVSIDARYVYWSDFEKENEAILRSLHDGTQREIIALTGLGLPEEIAVDWVTGNIYFTDSGYKRIGVCNNNGSYCTVVINERTDKPRGLALVPTAGTMYWSDWGKNPHISVASMDGKDSSPLVTDNVEWPNGLTIDYPNNRLYWVDAKLKMIESIRLDGKDRRTILHDMVKSPYSLAIFENKLYWSDWLSNNIESCDKFTGKDWRILFRESSTPHGIHIYHSVMKPKIRNPCNTDPCSQICLLNKHLSYTCACSLDKRLSTDQKSCIAAKKNKHIVIATGNTLIDYYHELLGKPKLTTSLTMKYVNMLAYDSLRDDLLISDQFSNTIFRHNMVTRETTKILDVQNELLGGMDFDYIGNNLYWSDIRHKTIEVYSLDTKGKTIFYFQYEPNDIALVPEERVMYVVLRIKDKYRIDKMQMNGLGSRMHITDNDLIGPSVSLCYDKDLKRIFWADQGSGRIESSTPEGSDKHLFRTGLAEPVSLAIVGEHIFWTQLGSHHLYSAERMSTLQVKRIGIYTPENENKLHLVSLEGIYVNDDHGCRKENGNCSHVCLPTNSQSYICACPPNMMLNASNRTCTTQTACDINEIKCSEHNICIKKEQRCNGIIDCPYGEDESDVCQRDNLCEKDQFACKNGDCISMKNRCNSKYDCKDKSDEEDCKDTDCKADEFQCHEGSCISKYLVCNGQYDCSDSSDEMNCDKYLCGEDSFKCDTGVCIPKSWECDNEMDCDDMSDEDEHCKHNTCGQNMFMCHNQRCIDVTLVCNAIDDCGDYSDERQCMPNKWITANCTSDEYRCYDSDICIHKSKKCDSIQDCPKGDDEHGCILCDGFICDNKKCIPQEWLCDNMDDCGDKSDEKDCAGTHTKNNSIESKCNEFSCSGNICIPYSKLCDGYIDCPDGGDEHEHCMSACTKNNPCQSICFKTPSGPKCGCQTGYRLADDGVSCMDIDECQDNVCSHICHNTHGSFVCSCYGGYVLHRDRKSCKIAGSQMEIITVAKKDIRKVSRSLDTIEVIHQESAFDISGLDVNINESTVYWSNDMLGMISMINLKTKEAKVVYGVGKPESIAVDWATDNVYFYDNEHPYAIKVCNLYEKKCAKILTNKGTSKVMSITVDPLHGWIFWSQTDWGLPDEPFSEICRTSTTGSNITRIIYKNLSSVNRMAIDYKRNRLYWIDSFLKVIESSNFDGTNRKTFLKTGNYQPLDINIYGESLYWLMDNTGKLQKCKLHGKLSCSMIDLGLSNIDKRFTIYHESRQPRVIDRCEEHTCDYMCISSRDDNFACICQDGKIIPKSSDCKGETSAKIKFVTHQVLNHADKNTQQKSSTVTALLITIVVGIVILSGYCYYKKIRVDMAKQNDVSICFQNPSFQKQEMLTSYNCVPLHLREHDYTNLNFTNPTKIEFDKKKEKKTIVPIDQPDNEFSELDCGQKTRLIQ